MPSVLCLSEISHGERALLSLGLSCLGRSVSMPITRDKPWKNGLIVINSYYIRIPCVNSSEGGKWILPFFAGGKIDFQHNVKVQVRVCHWSSDRDQEREVFESTACSCHVFVCQRAFCVDTTVSRSGFYLDKRKQLNNKQPISTALHVQVVKPWIMHH